MIEDLTLQERSLLATAADFMALHLEKSGQESTAAHFREMARKIEAF